MSVAITFTDVSYLETAQLLLDEVKSGVAFKTAADGHIVALIVDLEDAEIAALHTGVNVVNASVAQHRLTEEDVEVLGDSSARLCSLQEDADDSIEGVYGLSDCSNDLGAVFLKSRSGLVVGKTLAEQDRYRDTQPLSVVSCAP